MSNFRNVSKSEPCPICGKPDWCTVQYVEENTKLHYCRRVLGCSNIISGTNGMSYVFLKQTSDGSCMYKEESAYMESRKEWEKANGRNRCANGRRAKPKSPPVKQPPAPQPAVSVTPLDNGTLDAIYRAFLKKLHLQKNHVRYLKQKRWPDQLIIHSQVRSMPPGGNGYYYGKGRDLVAKELVREFGSLKGVPGFYEQADGKWNFAGQSGLLIPLYDHERKRTNTTIFLPFMKLPQTESIS